MRRRMQKKEQSGKRKHGGPVENNLGAAPWIMKLQIKYLLARGEMHKY